MASYKMRPGVTATWAKTGDGDVVLGGGAANTFSGLTRVFGGRLVIEKDGALGTAGSGSGATGNTFQNTGSASTIAFRAPIASGGFNYNTFEVINTSGTGAPGFGQVDNLGGNNSFAGNIAFDGPVMSGARQVSIGVASGSLNVTGGMYARGNDGTPRNLTKLGAGKLIVSGDGGAATANTLVVPFANSTFNVNAGTVEMRGPSLATANLPGRHDLERRERQHASCIFRTIFDGYGERWGRRPVQCHRRLDGSFDNRSHGRRKLWLYGRLAPRIDNYWQRRKSGRHAVAGKFTRWNHDRWQLYAAGQWNT